MKSSYAAQVAGVNSRHNDVNTEYTDSPNFNINI